MSCPMSLTTPPACVPFWCEGVNYTLSRTPLPYDSLCSSLNVQWVALSSLQSHMPPHSHHSSFLLLSCARRLSTPCRHTCHTHNHSGLWHAASIITRLHSVHFSPHMNTGLHPAGLCGQISIIISKHLSVSNGPTAVALQSIVKLTVSVTECV